MIGIIIPMHFVGQNQLDKKICQHCKVIQIQSRVHNTLPFWYNFCNYKSNIAKFQRYFLPPRGKAACSCNKLYQGGGYENSTDNHL